LAGCDTEAFWAAAAPTEVNASVAGVTVRGPAVGALVGVPVGAAVALGVLVGTAVAVGLLEGFAVGATVGETVAGVTGLTITVP
jgi:hypothetical protein